MSSGRPALQISIKSVAVWLLALYFLLAPMEDLLTSDIGTLGKYIIILTMGLFLLPVLQTRCAKFSSYTWDISKIVLYLILLAWVSIIWASDFSTAISRNSAYTTLPLVFIVLSMNEFTDDERRTIQAVALLGGLLAVTYIVVSQGMAHVLSGRMTLVESGNDPNNLAALFLLPTGLAFDGIFKSTNGKRLLYILPFGVLSLFTLFTGSRGGLLSLAVFAIAYFAAGGYLKHPARAIGFLLLLTVVAYIIIQFLPQEIFFRLFSGESYQSAAISSGQRGAIWRHVVFDAIPNMKPWGYGSGCAFEAMIPFYGYRKGIHNTYLCMILEYGIFGIPAFLLLLWKILKKLSSDKRNAEFAILLGIMCSIFFLDSYAKKYFWNVMYLAIISLRTSRGQEYGKENINHHNVLPA